MSGRGIPSVVGGVGLVVRDDGDDDVAVEGVVVADVQVGLESHAPGEGQHQQHAEGGQDLS